MAEKSIPVSDVTLARLQELASWGGVSVDRALEQAVGAFYERRFWEVVNAGYAALRADPAAWAEVEAERKLWDGTLMDGLGPSERWTENGDVIPPAQEEHGS